MIKNRRDLRLTSSRSLWSKSCQILNPWVEFPLVSLSNYGSISHWLCAMTSVSLRDRQQLQNYNRLRIKATGAGEDSDLKMPDHQISCSDLVFLSMRPQNDLLWHVWCATISANEFYWRFASTISVPPTIGDLGLADPKVHLWPWELHDGTLIHMSMHINEKYHGDGRQS